MIKLGVLGALAVTRDGRPVTLPTPMLRRLLALLLSHAGTPIAVEVIADALWSGRPPRTARKTLAVYVHRLRKLLGSDLGGDDERIGSSPAGYWITAGPDELDSLAFDRLATQATATGDRRLAEEALALFRGRPYEEFCDIEQIARVAETLTERRLVLLEQRIQIDLDSGRHAELIGELNAVVAEHPYRERFRAQQMLALYRAGRQADALEAYRHTHRVLGEELGVEPVPEIQALHQKILRADPALAAWPDRGPVPRLLPRDVPDFTGRDADLRWLDDVADTPGSTAVITAIAGTAGVGKTKSRISYISYVALERFSPFYTVWSKVSLRCPELGCEGGARTGRRVRTMRLWSPQKFPSGLGSRWVEGLHQAHPLFAVVRICVAQTLLPGQPRMVQPSAQQLLAGRSRAR